MASGQTQQTATSDGQNGSDQPKQDFLNIPWPNADLDKAAVVARAWQKARDDLKTLQADCQGTVDRLVAANSGPAVEAFKTYWSTSWTNDAGQAGGSKNGCFPGMVYQCDALATLVNKFIDLVNGARAKLIALGITMAAATVVAVVVGIFTFGAGGALVEAGAGAGTAAAATAIILGLMDAIATGVAEGIIWGFALGAITDLENQWIDIHISHTQTGFNLQEFEADVQQGEEFGALTGGIAGGLGFAARAVGMLDTLASGAPWLARLLTAESRDGLLLTLPRDLAIQGASASGADQVLLGRINPLDVVMALTMTTVGGGLRARFEPSTDVTTEVDPELTGGRDASLSTGALDTELPTAAVDVTDPALAADGVAAPVVDDVVAPMEGAPSASVTPAEPALDVSTAAVGDSPGVAGGEAEAAAAAGSLGAAGDPAATVRDAAPAAAAGSETEAAAAAGGLVAPAASGDLGVVEDAAAPVAGQGEAASAAGGLVAAAPTGVLPRAAADAPAAARMQVDAAASAETDATAAAAAGGGAGASPVLADVAVRGGAADIRGLPDDPTRPDAGGAGQTGDHHGQQADQAQGGALPAPDVPQSLGQLVDSATQRTPEMFGGAGPVRSAVEGLSPDPPPRGYRGGFNPDTGLIRFERGFLDPLDNAIRAGAEGRPLTHDELIAAQRAAWGLFHEEIHGVYPEGSPHFPDPGDPAGSRARRAPFDTYQEDFGFNLEEGHTDWAARDRFAEWTRRTGLADAVPGIDDIHWADIPDNPYRAQIEMARAFARAGGADLLGFDSVDDYRDAQAAQNDFTRVRWMADRIIEAKGLPDTPEVRTELESTIRSAFDEKLPEQRGMAAGRRLGVRAYQTILGRAARLWQDARAATPDDVGHPTQEGGSGGEPDSGLRLWRLQADAWERDGGERHLPSDPPDPANSDDTTHQPAAPEHAVQPEDVPATDNPFHAVSDPIAARFGEKPTQHLPPGDLPERVAELYRRAGEAQPEIQETTERVASVTGGEPRTRDGLKSLDRAMEKIEGDYGNDPTRLLDVTGGMVLYEGLDEVYEALRKVDAGEAGPVDIQFLKDRFTRPVPSGFRDILMNIRTSGGHIGELRLGLDSFAEYSAVEHEHYEEIRSIEAAARREGDRPFTPQESARIQELVQADLAVYRRLWEEVLRRLQEGQR